MYFNSTPVDTTFNSGGFCFHTAKTSFLLPLDEAKRGLTMLAKEGMKKINFSGGICQQLLLNVNTRKGKIKKKVFEKLCLTNIFFMISLTCLIWYSI